MMFSDGLDPLKRYEYLNDRVKGRKPFVGDGRKLTDISWYKHNLYAATLKFLAGKYESFGAKKLSFGWAVWL
jgi:hypothetical protein